MLTRSHNSSFIKLWSILLVIFLIYGFVELILTNGRSRLFIINCCESMLPLYPFFIFSEKGYLTNKTFRKWGPIFLLVAFISFNYGQSIALHKITNPNVNVIGVTNNMGYFIAFMLPLFYFWKRKPLVLYVSFLILFILTILALKRGAIILALVSVVLIIIHLSKITNKKLVIALLGVLFVIGLAYFLRQQYVSNDYLLERYERTINGDTSNRGEIYKNAIIYYKNEMDPAKLLFGLGANGSVKAIHIEAHNDWVEILFSQGYFGFVVFLLFWINVYRTFRSIINKEIKFLFGLVMLLLFIRTFFSMSISDIYFSSTSIIGFCLANKNNLKQEIV